MIANRASLDALFMVFRTAFNEAVAEANHRVTPNTMLVDDVAMTILSSGAATTHAWMGQVPSMREWIGDRLVQDIIGEKLVVTNDNYENTVGLSRNDIEDDQYQTFTHVVRALGGAAEAVWKQLAIKALLGNGTWADVNPFFCSGRKLSADSGTMTNASTAALSGAAVEAAIAAMLSWKLHGGREAGATPEVLLVGPSLLASAKQIVEAQIVAQGGAGVSNVSPAMMLSVRFTPLITNNQWYVLGNKFGIRPVAVQKRKPATLTRMDADTDEHVFTKNEVRYGADARGAGFLTMPFLAYAGGMASVPAWADPEE